MAPFPLVRTERLLLRRFSLADVPAFMAYRNDEQVQRFDGVRPCTVGQARAFIREQALLPAGEPGIWLQIAIDLPGTGLIGDCGFMVDPERTGTAEVGYRLNPAFWGRGYAAEAVSGLMDWAFDALGVHRVIALIDTRNERSIALVNRLGFRREGHLLEAYREPDGWSDEYLYAILDHEWRAQPAG